MSGGVVRLATVLGARPQFVKAAAVSKALASDAPEVEEVMVHTGQHYDPSMSEVFFEELGIPAPAHHLEVGSGGHGAQTGEMMARLESVFEVVEPDVVMVYGDTNSTLAGALVAAKADLPLVHVEAGLRSGVRAMPEEVNRVVTDHLATMLLCPCERAVSQLAAEGITSGVHDVGDVMLDVLLANLDRAVPAERTRHRLGLGEGPLVVATVHRPSNTDDPHRLAMIVQGINSVAEHGHEVVWPVHPRVTATLADAQFVPGVHTCEPLSYLELLGLLPSSALVLTDSGGVQREAFWLGVPCVTLRSETEWPETVETGFNHLWGETTESLWDVATTAMRHVGTLGAPPPVYGTGSAANAIATLLRGTFR